MFFKLTVFSLLSAGSLLCSADQSLQKTELFVGGNGGYKLYRIPGVVVSKRGTILTYSEGRRKTGGDWDTIDVLLRRSEDGGRNFSPPVSIAHVDGEIHRNPVAIERKQGQPDDVTYNNPVAIADRNGSIHFLFCLDYMRVFYMVSKDDGRTFSKAHEITGAFESLRPSFAWRVVATGPGHGIQLSNGRLIVPSWVALGTTGNGHGPASNTTLYSDDHGRTWHTKGLAVSDSKDIHNANETAAVELSDRRVMLNARAGSERNRRVITISRDGESGWSSPHYQDDLPDPICMAGFVRFSTANHGGRDRLLFSNPDNLIRADGRQITNKDRRNLTVRLSYDEGASWTVKRSLEPGPSGYSDLAVLPDGSILCFYEASRDGESGGAAERLVLSKFNLDWLTQGQETYSFKGRK